MGAMGAMNGFGNSMANALVGAQPGVGMGLGAGTDMWGGMGMGMGMGMGGYGMGGYGMGMGGYNNMMSGMPGGIVATTNTGSPCAQLCYRHQNCKLGCVSPSGICNCIFPTNCNCADYFRH